MKRNRVGTFLLCAAASALVQIATAPGAFAAPILGPDLASFAVLGATTVTNVPTSTIVGSVGVAPGTAITGFNSTPNATSLDPQVTGGVVDSNTAVAIAAQAQLTTARNNLTSLGVGTTLAADLTLAGVITPGVYTVLAGPTNLSGSLTLDGLGDPNAFWRFQFASTLITSPGSSVSVINTTAAGAGVFWNVGSSATIDTTTAFLGNILALTSITLNTNATIGCGRALADTGAVTMDQNTISTGCLANGLSGGTALEFIPDVGVVDTTTPTPTVVAAVPEPGTLVLLGTGIACLVARKVRSARRNLSRELTVAAVSPA